jgi:NADH-quinone oxidoreductase subunit N
MPEFVFLQQLPAVLPEVGLTLLALIVLAADVGFLWLSPLPESRKNLIPYISGFGMLAVAILPLVSVPTGELMWGGMVRHDTLAQIFKTMVIVAGAFTCFIAGNTRSLGRKGEFYLIIIVSTLGASLLSASADLIMIFVALETISIPLYILAAFRRDEERSVESGVKYFLFGSFASAMLLYGFSLLYGFTGQTNIYTIAEFLSSATFDGNPIPVLVSVVLVVVGFGFKISAVPFHFWTPDVYEGAPTPVTAFVSVASKAASFAVVVRFFIAVFPEGVVIGSVEIRDFWLALIAAASVVSMTLGNLVALQQRNVKRLLAYSSIAQAGYTLIGVAALYAQSGDPVVTTLNTESVAAIAFYLLMYTFTNLLAFAVVVIFSEVTGSETIADFAGLSRRNPWMALTMTVAFLSLAGIPPAAGFFGKFFLFNAAVRADLVWLAIIGVLNSIVALYYYLIFIKVMYVDRSPDDDQPIRLTTSAAWVLGATTVIVLILGVIPGAVFNWALESARMLS